MGLDMYLHNSKNEEVVYWRKANQIRGWLVSHGIIQRDDNCEKRVVTKQNLIDLVNDCKTVLSDHSKAQKLLPVTSGFFFGSEAYNEWYFSDLEETIKNLEPLIKDGDENYIYHDWW